MTEEDFIAWRENPVTKRFMAAFANTAEIAEREWKDRSWQTGQADQQALDILKAKHAAYTAVSDATFEDIEARQDEHERD